jgi:hypothetical protein
MANPVGNPNNRSHSSASVPGGPRSAGVSDGVPLVQPVAGFSIAAMKLIAISGTSRELAPVSGVSRSTIRRIRTQPGYQPSESNQAKLVAAGWVEPNDFRRWPEDAHDVVVDAQPDEVAPSETDLSFVYGCKVRRSQIRTALRELEPRLTEIEMLLGSPEYEDFHRFTLSSLESFAHPDAPDSDDPAEVAIIERHIQTRGPDCLLRSVDVIESIAAARRGDRPMPECCARGLAELHAYGESEQSKAWQAHYETALRSHAAKVYGCKCTDAELATADFALALVRSLLPAPRLDGPMRQNLRLVGEFKALVCELEERIGKISQRTRVHLQAAQLLESLHSEQARLDKSINVQSLSAWSEMMTRFCAGLAPHEALRNHLASEYENRHLLHYELLASFEFDDLPVATRNAISKFERRTWIGKRRGEMQRAERVWQ